MALRAATSSPWATAPRATVAAASPHPHRPRGYHQQCASSANSVPTRPLPFPRGLTGGPCRASASAEDKIDPTSGELISENTKDSVEVNGTRWSYRKTEGDGSGKPTVVLVHGALSSSYSYRRVIDLLGKAGYRVVAPDWPGHGDSGAPAPGKFGYGSADYVHQLAAFLHKVLGGDSKFVFVTQGFVLGQYGMLYALKNPDKIDKLVILNTPLQRNTPLPAILSKLKGSEPGLFGLPNPFAQKQSGPLDLVDAGNYMQGGSPYYLDRDDAEAYQGPFESQEFRDAAQKMMEECDYDALLDQVDEGFRTWRNDSLVAFGTSDYYIKWETASEWLEDKRTSMKFYTFTDKMGHAVQDDYPERVSEVLQNFMEGVDVQKKVDPSIKRGGDFTE